MPQFKSEPNHEQGNQLETVNKLASVYDTLYLLVYGCGLSLLIEVVSVLSSIGMVVGVLQ